MAGLIEPDDIDFSVYEHETEGLQKVRPASEAVQTVIDRVRNPVREKRVFMPWGKTHRLLHFRRGEVTVWGGENGSGKSLLTGQVALSLCAQDEKVCVASFEMKPAKTMERMGRQWTRYNVNYPLTLATASEAAAMLDHYEQFRDWTDGKLWLYDQQGTVAWKRVCAIARYCAKELGITQFFIDNLMKCVAGEDDYNGQKAFVDELCAIARDHDIHIHLVHHVKKPANAGQKPSKYHFKGSGAITDQPDNVIAIWRNEAKELALQQKKIVDDEKDADTILILDKQRNGEGWTGWIALWFERASHQFTGTHHRKAMTFYKPPVDDPQEEM